MDNRVLTLDDALDIAGRYLHRRDVILEEDETTSLLVVLLNYGDHLTKVSCIGGEWAGFKGQLIRGEGEIPHCPDGHPLIESVNQYRLGLIQDIVI
jgi:hypothetical protein